MSPLTEPTGPPPGPAGTDRGLRTTTVVVAGPWRTVGRAATMGRMFLIALVVIGSVCGAFALAVIHADRVNKWLWVLPQRLRGRGWGWLLVPLGVAYAMLDRTDHRFVAVAGLWLLVRVQAPGAGWVHAIAARWRSGARRGILPWQGFLLLPVVVLAMELLGARDWFGVQWFSVPLAVAADAMAAVARLGL